MSLGMGWYLQPMCVFAIHPMATPSVALVAKSLSNRRSFLYLLAQKAKVYAKFTAADEDDPPQN
jgi:hypothetical protein